MLILKDHESKTGDLPGGRISEDEFFGDWIESLQREITEELGKSIVIEIDREPIFVKDHRMEADNFPCVLVAYSGIYIGGEIRLSNEHDFFKWVDIHEFDPKGFFSSTMLKAVEHYLQKFGKKQC